MRNEYPVKTNNPWSEKNKKVNKYECHVSPETLFQTISSLIRIAQEAF